MDDFGIHLNRGIAAPIAGRFELRRRAFASRAGRGWLGNLVMGLYNDHVVGDGWRLVGWAINYYAQYNTFTIKAYYRGTYYVKNIRLAHDELNALEIKEALLNEKYGWKKDKYRN